MEDFTSHSIKEKNEVFFAVIWYYLHNSASRMTLKGCNSNLAPRLHEAGKHTRDQFRKND